MSRQSQNLLQLNIDAAKQDIRVPFKFSETDRIMRRPLFSSLVEPLLLAVCALSIACAIAPQTRRVALPTPSPTPTHQPPTPDSSDAINRPASKPYTGKGDNHGIDKEIVIEEAERAGFVLINQYDFVKPDKVDYFLVFRAQ